MTRIRSALARPLDRRYPTNLAVLVLAPSAGVMMAGLAFWQGAPVPEALTSAMRGGLTAFAAWALARELAPDDNPAAFVSMALALLGCLLVPAASVALVFTALMLARIVNRSVGVPATLLDSTAVTLLAGWTMYHTRHGGPGVVAAIAFALDALLSSPLRRQWAFAAVCLAGSIGFILLGEAGATASSHNLPVVTIATLYAVMLLRTRRVHSVADRTAAPLVVGRVRGGMAVAWLMAVQGPLTGDRGLTQSWLVWVVLAGLIVTWIYRQAFSLGAGGDTTRRTSGN